MSASRPQFILHEIKEGIKPTRNKSSENTVQLDQMNERWNEWRKRKNMFRCMRVVYTVSIASIFHFSCLLSRVNGGKSELNWKILRKIRTHSESKERKKKKYIKRLHKNVINLMTCMRVYMKLNRFPRFFYLILLLFTMCK